MTKTKTKTKTEKISYMPPPYKTSELLKNMKKRQKKLTFPNMYEEKRMV